MSRVKPAKMLMELSMPMTSDMMTGPGGGVALPRAALGGITILGGWITTCSSPLAISPVVLRKSKGDGLDDCTVADPVTAIARDTMRKFSNIILSHSITLTGEMWER